MTVFKKLRNKARAEGVADHPKVRGTWFNIRIIPDLATGETLNIGVGFVGQDNRLELKLLDRFDAFDCLYRNRLSVENVRLLVQIVRVSMPEGLQNGQTPVIPSPHVMFSSLKFISGDSIHAILDDLYRETVTMAHVAPAKGVVEEKPDSLSNKLAREKVFDAMFQIDSAAMHIVAETSKWSIPVPAEDGHFRVLDMPLRDPRRFGNVISVWSPQRAYVELNTLRAAVDLDLAMRIYPKNNGGLFVLLDVQVF